MTKEERIESDLKKLENGTYMSWGAVFLVIALGVVIVVPFALYYLEFDI